VVVVLDTEDDRRRFFLERWDGGCGVGGSGFSVSAALVVLASRNFQTNPSLSSFFFLPFGSSPLVSYRRCFRTCSCTTNEQANERGDGTSFVC